jgi:hypothetical protein
MCKKLIYIFSFVLVLGMAGLSNAAVIGFQAESGTLGADFDPPISDLDGLALGGRYITTETTSGGGSPGTEDRIATYTVTFPEAGTYEFYARLMVEDQLNPQAAADNDSMFYGRGFGTKTANSNADWVQCNGLDMNPFDEYGWFNLTEAVGYGAVGVSFTVPEGELTQTFQVGAREDGLRMDAFVFVTATETLSDADLDAAVPVETKAVGPIPADGSTVPETSLTLSWRPGALSTHSHIYFSDNFDEVNDRTAQADKALTTEITYAVSGLVPGTMYYWAIDETNVDDNLVWPGDVWRFQVESQTAYNPNPYDGKINTVLDVVLSWSAGVGAVSHKVYLDPVEANVEARNDCLVNGIDTNAANYSPGPLDSDMTYYWAIDEVGADDTTFAGEVWSFTTVPDIQMTNDPNLIGWWTFDEGAGMTALDWSGHGNHGAIQGNPTWIAGPRDDTVALDFDGVGDFVDCGKADIFDVTGQITVAAWIRVDVFEQTDQAIVSKGQNVWRLVRNGLDTDQLRFDCGGQAIGSTNVNDGEWHHALGMSDGVTVSLYVDGALDGSAAGGAIPTDPNLTLWIADTNRPGAGPQAWNGPIDDVRVYNKALTQQEIGQIMRFDPLLAWNPSPSSGAVLDLIAFDRLSWSPGDEAAEHDVYIGTDKESVANADTSTADIYRGRQQDTTFTISEGVQANQTYFWRIDEINNDMTTTIGGIWTFTIADYLIVDDFESYNDLDPSVEGSRRIYLIWADGFDNPTLNGSTMGYPAPNFAEGEHFVETDIVYQGSQSAPIIYDNTTANYSEVTVNTNDLSIGTDWTIGSPDTLSLWIYGDPNNSTTEQMYVKVNNVKVVYDGNLNTAEWQQWTIDLTSLGVNLNNVTTLSIGFEPTGATGGTGMVFVDDIRLLFPTDEQSVLGE